MFVKTLAIVIVALATFSSTASAAVEDMEYAMFQSRSGDIIYMVGVADVGSSSFADAAVDSSSDSMVEDAFNSVDLSVVQSVHMTDDEADKLGVSESALYQIESDSGDGFIWIISKGPILYQFLGIGNDLDTEDFATWIVSVLDDKEVPTTAPAGFKNVTPKG